MNLYIIGPMTGKPDLNRAAFAEAFAAWQRYEGDEWDDTDSDLENMLRDDIADELADTVQACVNLADREGFLFTDVEFS